MQAAKSDVKSGESPGPARPCRQAWLLQAVCQDKAHSVGSGILPAGVVVVLGDSVRETPGSCWSTPQMASCYLDTFQHGTTRNRAVPELPP